MFGVNSNLLIKILLLFLAVFPLESESQGGILAVALEAYEENFVSPGSACDEDLAKTKYNGLILKHGNITAIQQADKDSLVALSNSVCAFSKSFEIHCRDKRCACSDPRKEFNSQLEICLLKFGEACTFGNECSRHLICSNERDPSRLNVARQGIYRWKHNSDCTRDCLVRLCGRESESCNFNLTNCLLVSRCLQNPYEIPYQCIGECLTCPPTFELSDFFKHETCEADCAEERDSYTDNLINLACYAECQHVSDGQECYKQCAIRNLASTGRQRRHACPFSSQFKRTGCTNCVWDTIAGGIFQQIRKNCTDDCPGKGGDNSTCQTRCTEHCIQQKSIDAELECYFQCGTPGSKDPMCFILSCHNNLNSAKIYQSCNATCTAPPATQIDTPCDRCSRTCRLKREMELQLGRSELTPRCKEMCKIPKHECHACENHFRTSKSICLTNCDLSEDCETTCLTSCQTNLGHVRQAKCYSECYRRIDSLKCESICLEKFNKDPPDKVCKSECEKSQKTKDCSICKANCERSTKELSEIYCNNTTLCEVKSQCQICQSDETDKCKSTCRPPGASENPERCLTQCLDVCDRGRHFFVGLDFNKGRYVPSCELFCDQSPLSKCVTRCENFCDISAPFRCDCKEDGTAKPFLIPVLEPDPCRMCRRRLRENLHKECRVKCVPSAALDPNGINCFSGCLEHCEKAEWVRQQLICEECKKTSKTCEPEQKCLDKATDYHKIRSRCFERCYNVRFDPNHFVCFPQRCQDQCAEEAFILAPIRCIRPTPTSICDDTPPPKFSSIPNLTTCDTCTRDTRVLQLDVCRKRCEIKASANLTTVTKFCSKGCKENCLTRLLWTQYKTCQKSTPEDVTKCVKDAAVALKLNCDTNADECPPSNLTFGECPSCINQCYRHDFFEDAARITCNPCNETFKPSKIIFCEICKMVMVDSTCTPLPDRCEPQKNCTMFHCVTACRDDPCGIIVDNCIKQPDCMDCMKNPPANMSISTCMTNCIESEQNIQTRCMENCTAKPPSECTSLCTTEVCIKEKLNVVCEQECKEDLSLSLKGRRRRQVNPGRGQPTRKPSVDPFNRHWCCFNNSQGHCNSSNPTLLGITEASSLATCVQEIITLIGISFVTVGFILV